MVFHGFLFKIPTAYVILAYEYFLNKLFLSAPSRRPREFQSARLPSPQPSPGPSQAHPVILDIEEEIDQAFPEYEFPENEFLEATQDERRAVPCE